LLQNDVIVRLATKYNKSPAQICLRWAVQKNIVVLPKSVKPERLYENANVSLLSNS
jgi:diketogulonate reductase-like aldo/keto reductase